MEKFSKGSQHQGQITSVQLNADSFLSGVSKDKKMVCHNLTVLVKGETKAIDCQVCESADNTPDLEAHQYIDFKVNNLTRSRYSIFIFKKLHETDYFNEKPQAPVTLHRDEQDVIDKPLSNIDVSKTPIAIGFQVAATFLQMQGNKSVEDLIEAAKKIEDIIISRTGEGLPF